MPHLHIFLVVVYSRKVRENATTFSTIFLILYPAFQTCSLHSRHDCNISFLHSHTQKKTCRRQDRYTHKPPFVSPDPDGNSTTDSCIYRNRTSFFFFFFSVQCFCRSSRKPTLVNSVLRLHCSDHFFCNRILHYLETSPFPLQSAYTPFPPCGMQLSEVFAHSS